MDESSLYLPPGFRFHPTDEEIITHYLSHKIADRSFSPIAIAEANFNDCEPWDLPSKAKMGEKEWFFFCQKDRKYPTGMRTNRATESGYWKATGKDKEIYKGKRVLVGMKKTLVFYIGRAPRGQKSNWVMHEYRLQAKHNHHFNCNNSVQDEWVVYKVYNKIKDTNMVPTQHLDAASANSFVDDFLVETPSSPSLMDSSFFNSNNKEFEESVEDLINERGQTIYFSQTHNQAPFLSHHAEETMCGPLISDQDLYAKMEQSSNSIVSAGKAYADDPSSGLQVLDFDSILNYGFV